MLFFGKYILTVEDFDRFEEAFKYGKGADGYGELRLILLNLARWCYHNILTIAIYCSCIAVLIAATCLILNARNRIKLGEAKAKVVRVMIVSILIFGAASLIQLVNSLGIRAT